MIMTSNFFRLPKEISYAPTAFKLLNGCFCVYKPAELVFKNTIGTIKKKLTICIIFF